MYSERLMALFQAPVHGGVLPEATHRGVGGTPGGGPFLVLSLRVADGVIREARFQTYGCPAAIACSEAACAWSEGQPLDRLQKVTTTDVARWVEGVPEHKQHCLSLAVQALAHVAPLAPPVE